MSRRPIACGGEPDTGTAPLEGGGAFTMGGARGST